MFALSLHLPFLLRLSLSLSVHLLPYILVHYYSSARIYHEYCPLNEFQFGVGARLFLSLARSLSFFLVYFSRHFIADSMRPVFQYQNRRKHRLNKM